MLNSSPRFSGPCSLVILLACTACGGERTADPVAAPASQAAATSEAPMRAFVPPSAPPSAEAPSPARLVGRWKPDPADVATDPDLLRLPKAAQAEAIAAAGRILDGITFEFTADGTVHLQDGPVKRTGRYTTEPADGGLKVRVTLAREEEAPRDDALWVQFEGAALRITTGENKSRRFIARSE